MPTLEFRFRPPTMALEVDLAWLLGRAFGPAAEPASEVKNAERALELAQRFDLAARVAARQGFETLVADLGRTAATELFLLRASAKAESVRLDRTANLIAEAGAALSVPMVFLKYQALHELGVLLEGSRFACDVDVLVPAARAYEVAGELVSRGYEAGDYAEKEHQLSFMTSPNLSPVEVHRLIPGLRLVGHGNSASLEDLQAAGLVEHLGRHPGQCFVPDRSVLVAHVIVHGIAQHGLSPSAYSMTRMLADLIDLGVCEPDGQALVDSARPLISRSVSDEETTAVVELCRRLSRGDLAIEGQEERPEVRLLHHILAGELDLSYAESLRLTIHRPGLSDRPLPLVLAQRLWGMVFKTRAELDAIYGPSKSWFGYLCRRLLRPLDLVYRFFRYGVHYAAVRVRKRTSTRD